MCAGVQKLDDCFAMSRRKPIRELTDLPNAFWRKTGSRASREEEARERLRILDDLPSYPQFGFPYSEDLDHLPPSPLPAALHVPLTALRKAGFAMKVGYVVFMGVPRPVWRRSKRGDRLVYLARDLLVTERLRDS